MWDLSVNGHWLFPVADKVTVYPLAGLGILGSKVNIPSFGLGDGVSQSDFGFNIGGGIDYKLTDKMILNTELKYKIAGDWKRLFFSAGVAYKF
jgi:outer membrane protein X